MEVEGRGGVLWCFTFDFPFRLIGAPQLVRPVTCRSFTDKQGRHGSITHSYNPSLSPSLPSLPPPDDGEITCQYLIQTTSFA